MKIFTVIRLSASNPERMISLLKLIIKKRLYSSTILFIQTRNCQKLIINPEKSSVAILKIEDSPIKYNKSLLKMIVCNHNSFLQFLSVAIFYRAFFLIRGSILSVVCRHHNYAENSIQPCVSIKKSGFQKRSGDGSFKSCTGNMTGKSGSAA